MKKYFQFTKKTFLTFLGLGVLVLVVDFLMLGFLISFNKSIILMGFRFIFVYLPLVFLGIIFIRDIWKGNFARSISFFLGLYISFIGYMFFVPAVSDYAKRRDFDSVSWKNEAIVNELENPIRLSMLDDLLKKHELVGMTRNQIDELLGVPKPTGYFNDYDYVYWLGPERGFISIDSEWLGVKFTNNIVSEAKILRD